MYADDSRGGHIAAGKQLPLQDMPVIVGSKDELLSMVTKDENKPMTFHLSSTAPMKYENGMTLVPFSSLHECRYMVYWPVLSEEQWKERVAAQKLEENERAALEMITTDKVTCGEQQPESDHFVKMENSRNGDNNGRHWRMAGRGGWFSYLLCSKGNEVRFVRVICTGREGSQATVTMNGIEAGTIRTAVPNTDEIFMVPVPEELATSDQITVSFSAAENGMSPMFYEVRLTK